MKFGLIKYGIIQLFVCFILISCIGLKAADYSIEARTIDEVLIGNTESENDHTFIGLNSRTGFHNSGNWRSAAGDDGGFFQYNLNTNGQNNLSLWVRYWGNDSGNRNFSIFIDENYFVSENIGNRWNEPSFYSIEYPIPENMIKNKKSINVKFQSIENNTAGGIYGLRIIENKNKIKQQKETKMESLIEIVNVYRQNIPEMSFIGKKGTNWGLWWQNGWFDLLEKYIDDDFKEKYEDWGAYLGMSRFNENGDFIDYYVGMFLPNNINVPDGFEKIELPNSSFGVCWVYGKSDFVHGKTNFVRKRLLEDGYKIVLDKNDFILSIERDTCPRFTTPDEKGNVIVDVLHFIE